MEGLRLEKSRVRIIGLIYFFIATMLTLAQVSRQGEVPEPVVDKAGKAKEPRIWTEEAGEPGKAGGPGTVEPGAIKEVEAGYDTVFRTLKTGIRDPVRAGIGEGEVGLGLRLRPTFSLPLAQWRTRPEDADIKIGNFYLDFRHLYGSILYSDNIYLDNRRKEDDVIGIIGVGLVAVYQIEENFRVALAGNIGYLPFRNKIGFGDPVQLLSATFTPLFMARMTYDIPVGGTDIHFFDTFLVRSRGYRAGESYDLFDTDTDEVDRAGRYKFRTPYDPEGRNNSYDAFEHYYYQNNVGASVSRLIPTETRITAGGYHQNFWYGGDAPGLDYRVDTIYVAAKSERENMRFKPFADYRVLNRARRSGWDQYAYAGFEGPVTKQIDFLGEFGYFDSGSSPVTKRLWTLRLTHRLGPFTRHAIDFSRQTTYPVRSIRTGVSYYLNQTLTKDIDAEVVFDRSRYNRLDDDFVDYTEWRTGIRFTYTITQRIAWRLGGYYRVDEYDNPAYKDVETYTIRNEFKLQLSKKFYGNLLYRFERRRATIDYDENLIMLTLVREL